MPPPAGILLDIDHPTWTRPQRVVCRDSHVAFGRSSSMDVTINHDVVSSHHLTLTRTGSVWSIRDESSTNGTVLNGHRLTPGTAEPLAAGDTLTIETVTIHIADICLPAPAVQDPGLTIADDNAVESLLGAIEDASDPVDTAHLDQPETHTPSTFPDHDGEAPVSSDLDEPQPPGHKKTTDETSSAVSSGTVTLWLTLTGVGLVVAAGTTLCVYLLVAAG